MVGILIVSQRQPIGKLISGLKPIKAKGFGGEIDFDQKIDRVEDKVEAAKEEVIWPPKPDALPETQTDEVAATAARMNEVQRKWEIALAAVRNNSRDTLPAELQIEQTWSRIERLLEDLLDEEDALPPLHAGPSLKQMLTMARSFDVIPESVAQAIQELYNLRSKVVHTGYGALSASEGERFADSARTVEAILDFFLSAVRARKAQAEKDE